jgi:hypothetical protein
MGQWSSATRGDQAALVLGALLPVEADRGGQGQHPLADPDEHPAQGSATMLFQPELVFEGTDDRLDPLAHPAQRPEPAPLTLAVGPQQMRVQAAEVGLERFAGKPLVAQDDRAGRQRTLPGRVVQ